MKRLIAICCLALLAQPAFAQSAAEKAEKRLGELLTPGGGVAPPVFTAQPLAWKTSKALDRTDLPIRPYAGAPVRLPQPPVRAVKPRSAPEGTPLVSFREQPKGPKEVELPTKPLIRLPSLDVQTPLPIPILAQPKLDRASLGDPALDASVAAALQQFMPARIGPVPFVPLNLPDPFENIRHGQFRNPPDENAMPPAIPLRKPTK